MPAIAFPRSPWMLACFGPASVLGLALVLALFAPTVAGGGHAAAPATPDTVDEAPSGRWHRVAPGESLRSLADYYYGSGRSWRTLQVANDAELHPPTGTRLWIPAASVAWGPSTPIGSYEARP